MEAYANILQEIPHKKNIQRKKKRILFFSIVIGMLASICIVFPPDYVFIYNIIMRKNIHKYSDNEIQQNNKQSDMYLFNNYIAYYHIVQLAEHDSTQAKKILYSLLEKNISKGIRKKVLALLGELYLLDKDYSIASKYFWDLLILDTNNVNRVNYELVSNYADIFKQMSNEDASNFQSNTVQDNNLNSPVNLESIKQTNTFFLTVSDEKQDASLPQW